jgi:hypothetical protein
MKSTINNMPTTTTKKTATDRGSEYITPIRRSTPPRTAKLASKTTTSTSTINTDVKNWVIVVCCSNRMSEMQENQT